MRPLKNPCEVVVIGGGLSGLAAACHAARRGRLVTIFEGSGLYGGQVATVDQVDGLFTPGKLSGQDVAMHMLDEAKKLGVVVIEEQVAALRSGDRLEIETDAGNSYVPEAVVVASGASLRKLGVPGEDEFAGRGVSHCATCDGGFFRGQHVAVVGGGDAAVTEALVLARTSGTVTMVCRSSLKAKRCYIDRLDAQANVNFVWDSEVSEIRGENKVTGLSLRNARDGSVSELECAGIFPFIGVEPNCGFMPRALLDATGHIKAGPNLATGDPRIFAAGAARSGYGGQAAQALAEGQGAAEAGVQLLEH